MLLGWLNFIAVILLAYRQIARWPIPVLERPLLIDSPKEAKNRTVKPFELFSKEINYFFKLAVLQCCFD